MNVESRVFQTRILQLFSWFRPHLTQSPLYASGGRETLVLLASQIGVDDCGATPGMATAALTKILSIRAPVSFDTVDLMCHSCICFPLASLLSLPTSYTLGGCFSQLDSHKYEITLAAL